MEPKDYDPERSWNAPDPEETIEEALASLEKAKEKLRTAKSLDKEAEKMNREAGRLLGKLERCRMALEGYLNRLEKENQRPEAEKDPELLRSLHASFQRLDRRFHNIAGAIKALNAGTAGRLSRGRNIGDQVAALTSEIERKVKEADDQ
jgi:DNA repair ATPase RecN